MTGALPADVLLGMTLAALAAAVVAWILRGAGIAGGRPAAAVVGGLIAGVLLGPAVLGQSAPRLHERLYVGGIPERHALESLLARQAADRLALQAAPSGAADPDELRARHAAERAPLAAALESARARHRASFAGAVVFLLSLGLAAGAFAGRRPVALTPVASIAAALSLAAELLAVALLARWVFGLAWPLIVGLAAAGACGSAFAGLPMRWVPATGRTAAARSTSLVSFLLACVAVAVAAAPGAWPAAVAPAAGVVLGLAVRCVARPGLRARRIARTALTGVLIPAAVAVAALHIRWANLAADPWGWPLVLVLIIASGNAAVGGLWIGRRIARAPTALHDLIGWHAAGASVTQACLAAVLIAAGACDPASPLGSAALAGVLLSAAIGETTLVWMQRTLRDADHSVESL